MSYTSATIKNLVPDERGYKLDTGELVAVVGTVARDPVTQDLSITVNLRNVDSNGRTMHDRNGLLIHSVYTRTVPVQYVTDAGGISVIVQQTMNIAFGEEDALETISDNIRSAIYAAKLVGPLDLSSS